MAVLRFPLSLSLLQFGIFSSRFMHVHMHDLLPAFCLRVSHIMFPSFCPILISFSIYRSLAVSFDIANRVFSVKMALIFTFLLTYLLLEIVECTHTHNVNVRKYL